MTVNGIHHTGVLTRDLDGLEARYLSFGFTLSPRSRHLLSAAPGEPPTPGCTANRCAVLGGTYIELLGIVDETAPDPWHTKAMADRYEGFRILNLESGDLAADDARLTAAGLRTSGVLGLERDVDTEAGPRTLEAAAVHVDPAATPEGYLGLAHLRTPEYVHQPRYLKHPNGAEDITAVLIVAADAEHAAITGRYEHVLGAAPRQDGPLTVLDTGPARIEIVRASDAGEVLPGEPAPAASYLAAMTVRVADVGAARTLVEGGGTGTRTTPDGFHVSARDAFGAGLFFTS